MKVDGIHEVVQVAKAVGFGLDRLDFVVDALGGGIGGSEPEEGENPVEVFLQALGDSDDRLQATVGCPEVPALKEALGVAKEKLAKYKEMAQHLSQKRYNDESVVEYFQRVFPVLTTKTDSEKVLSKSAERAVEIINTNDQPGAEFGKGTWWEVFNATTYMVDHEIGRSADTRLTSAWYGANKNLKTKALETAVEMADAA